MSGDTSKSAKESVIENFVAGLKSRSDDIRISVARELQKYVVTDLQEMSMDDMTSFVDAFNKHIFDMISSADTCEKKGGIIAIIILVSCDIGNRSSQCTRYAHFLRNQPTNDTELMELTAFAIGKVALASGQLTTQYVEYEVKRAIEWLGTDKSETKRHGAVSNHD